MRSFLLATGLALACATSRASNNQLSPPNCQLPADLNDTTVYDGRPFTEKAFVLSGPDLSYPDRARQQGVQGRVLLSLIINSEGRAEPQSVVVVGRLDPEIDAEAVRYAVRAQFRPFCLEGRPVRVRTTLPIDFKINRR
jgi:TonB family protein